MINYRLHWAQREWHDRKYTRYTWTKRDRNRQRPWMWPESHDRVMIWRMSNGCREHRSCPRVLEHVCLDRQRSDRSRSPQPTRLPMLKECATNTFRFVFCYLYLLFIYISKFIILIIRYICIYKVYLSPNN